MESKMDYKKEYKDLYMPPQKPVLIDVPPMTMLMIDGKGEPGGACYQNAMAVLYAISFAIKMSKMGANKIPGYFEYVVPPLEGFWWSAQGALDLNLPREEWLWTSAIRQPEFVTPEVYHRALEESKKKKPELEFDTVRLNNFTEGMCVQMMHTGPYSTEGDTMAQIHAFIENNGLKDVSGDKRKHHEIYLGDPRKTAPEKLKTVLRVPVEKVE